MREENKLQGTGAWFNDRTGKLTASRMAAAKAFLKPKKDDDKPREAEARRKLKIEILAERLTGDIVPKYVTQEMQWGVDTEPLAKSAFENATGLLIQDVGFIPHPEIEYCGASPDGFTSDGGLIECKCPSTLTHLTWKLAGEVPEEHKPQMILQAACTGRSHVWFVSYDPRLPESQQLFIKKFEPIREEILEIEEHARQFLFEVEQMFDLLTKEM